MLEAHRVADRHDLVADTERRRIAQARGGQGRRHLEPEQGEIGHRVHPEHASRRLGPGIERDGERGRAVDDVRVGEDLAVTFDDDTRPHDRLEPALRLRLVDLDRLDGDDDRRHPLEERRERLGTRLGES